MLNQTRYMSILVICGFVVAGLLFWSYWPKQNGADSKQKKIAYSPPKDVSTVKQPEQPSKLSSATKKKFFVMLRGPKKETRKKQHQRLQEVYKQWKTSKDFQEFLRNTAAGNIKEASDFDRFLATTCVAGFGHPSSLGPNSLEKTRLKDYLQMQQSMNPSYAAEERHIALDPELNNLYVTVKPNKQNDLLFQEILWEIIQDYKLKSELRKGNTMYLTKSVP